MSICYDNISRNTELLYRSVHSSYNIGVECGPRHTTTLECNMPSKKNEPDPKVVFRVADLFFQGASVRDIAKTVNDEFPLAKPLNRESVYPLLAERTAGTLYGWCRLSKVNSPRRLPANSPAIPNTLRWSVRTGNISTNSSLPKRPR